MCRPRSKLEVMQEIIAKSKMYKDERKRDKSEKEEMIAEVDEQLKEIDHLLRRRDAPKDRWAK